MVSGDGHWICTSYSIVDGVNVYAREIQIARVYGQTSNTIESILANVQEQIGSMNSGVLLCLSLC